MAKRGICFDLDGTLINSGSGGLVRLCEVAKTLNLPMSEKIQGRLKAMWGQHPSNLINTAWPDTNIGAAYKQWEDLDIAEPFLAFPGTMIALARLYFNDFLLSILTSRNIRTTIPQLVHNDLLELFSLIIAADSSRHKKPHPESIRPIFDKYQTVGISPKDVIFVGDTIEGDWKLAQAVGIEFYAVLSGRIDTREKFLFAGVSENHIIDSVVDLPDILLNIQVDN